MFGAKDGAEMHAFRVRQQIDGAAAARIYAGLIGDQADAFSAERGELLVFEDVDAGLGVIARRGNAREIVRAEGVGAPVKSRRRYVRELRHVQRGRDRGRDLAAQARDWRAPGWMHGIRKQDYERLARGIDPDRRAGEARVAERAEREKDRRAATNTASRCPSPDRELRESMAAIAVTSFSEWKTPRESFQRSLRRDHSAVQFHFAKLLEVSGCREEARMSGDAADCARRRIVYDAAQHVPLSRAGFFAGGQIDFFGRRDSWNPAGRRQKSRLAHAQRLENVSSRKLIERDAGNFLDEFVRAR